MTMKPLDTPEEGKNFLVPKTSSPLFDALQKEENERMMGVLHGEKNSNEKVLKIPSIEYTNHEHIKALFLSQLGNEEYEKLLSVPVNGKGKKNLSRNTLIGMGIMTSRLGATNQGGIEIGGMEMKWNLLTLLRNFGYGKPRLDGKEGSRTSQEAFDSLLQTVFGIEVEKVEEKMQHVDYTNHADVKKLFLTQLGEKRYEKLVSVPKGKDGKKVLTRKELGMIGFSTNRLGQTDAGEVEIAGVNMRWKLQTLLNNFGYQKTRSDGKVGKGTALKALDNLLEKIFEIEVVEEEVQPLDYTNPVHIKALFQKQLAPEVYKKLVSVSMNDKGKKIFSRIELHKMGITTGKLGQADVGEVEINGVSMSWKLGTILGNFGRKKTRSEGKEGNGTARKALDCLLDKVFGIEVLEAEVQPIDYTNHEHIKALFQEQLTPKVYEKLLFIPVDRNGKKIFSRIELRKMGISTVRLGAASESDVQISGKRMRWRWGTLLRNYDYGKPRSDAKEGKGTPHEALDNLLQKVFGIEVLEGEAQPIDYTNPIHIKELFLKQLGEDMYEKLTFVPVDENGKKIISRTELGKIGVTTGRLGTKNEGSMEINGVNRRWNLQSLLGNFGLNKSRTDGKAGIVMRQGALDNLLQKIFGIEVVEGVSPISYTNSIHIKALFQKQLAPEVYEKLVFVSINDKGKKIIRRMALNKMGISTAKLGQADVGEVEINGVSMRWKLQTLLGNFGRMKPRSEGKEGNGTAQEALDCLLDKVFGIEVQDEEVQTIEYTNPIHIKALFQEQLTPKVYEKLLFIPMDENGKKIFSRIELRKMGISTWKLGQIDSGEVEIAGVNMRWKLQTLLNNFGFGKIRLDGKEGKGTSLEALDSLLQKVFGIEVTNMSTAELQISTLQRELTTPESSLRHELLTTYAFFGEFFGDSVLRDLILGDDRFREVPLSVVEATIREHIGNIRKQTSDPYMLFTEISQLTLQKPHMSELAEEALRRYSTKLILQHNRSFLTGKKDIFEDLYVLLEDKLLSIPKELAVHRKIAEDVLQYFLDLLTFELHPDLKSELIIDGLSKPFPSLNQLIHIFETLRSKRRLNADEVGTGKTGAALGASAYAKRVLILVPDNRLAGQWQESIKTFFKEEALPKSTILSGLTFPKENQDTKYMILSLPGLSGTSHEKRVQLMQDLKKWGYDMIITDEAHRAKTENALGTDMVKALISALPSDGMLNELTATPVPNKLDDLSMRLWAIFPDTEVHLTRGTEDMMKLMKDCTLTEIREMIFAQPNFVRNLLYKRTQQHTLEEIRGIPPATIEVNYTEMDAYQQILMETLLDDPEFFAQQKIWALQALMIDSEGHFGLRPVNENPKKIALINTIEKLLPVKKHIVVFCNQWAQGLTIPYARNDTPSLFETVKKRFPAVSVDVINAENKEHADVLRIRTQALERGSSITIVSGQVGAEGLDNLSFAKHVEIYNPPWNQAKIDQEVGRVRRAGQTDHISVGINVIRGSIEEGMMEMIQKKTEAIELVLKGGSLTDLQKQLLINDKVDLLSLEQQAPGLANYLLSSTSRLNAFFGSLKSLSKKAFLERIERVGNEYAELYKIKEYTSYPALNARAIAGLWKKLLPAESNGWIADIASGPCVLKKSLPEKYKILSVDANAHHFTDQDINTMVAHMTQLPVRSQSLIGANMSLCLQDLYVNTKDGIYDRLHALVEANRVLKHDGYLMISLSYGAAVSSLEGLKAFAVWCEKHLGFELVPQSSGTLLGTAAHKAQPGFESFVLTFQKKKDLIENLQNLKEEEERNELSPYEQAQEVLDDLVENILDMRDLHFDEKKRGDEALKKPKIVHKLHTEYALTTFEQSRQTIPAVLTEKDLEYLQEVEEKEKIIQGLKDAYGDITSIPNEILVQNKMLVISPDYNRPVQEKRWYMISTEGKTKGEYWKW